MAVGLRVLSSGSILVDPVSRLTRSLGVVNTGTIAGSVSVPDFSQGQPFYCLLPVLPPVGAKNRLYPIVVLDSSSLSWSFPTVDVFSSIWPTDIEYGVY